MVLILPSGLLPRPRTFRAYTHCTLELDGLDNVHSAFEVGALSKFPQPVHELFIYDREEFHGRHPADIRAVLNAEGCPEDFLLLDEHSVRPFDVKKAAGSDIWASTATLVADNVTTSDIQHGLAISNPCNGVADLASISQPVWKLRIPLEDLAIVLSKYEASATAMQPGMKQEILSNAAATGLDIPYYPDQKQLYPRPRISPEYHLKQSQFMNAYVVALAEEYETSTIDQVFSSLKATPCSHALHAEAQKSLAYRLKLQVAVNNGLRQRWVVGVQQVDMDMWQRLRQAGEIPNGTIVLMQWFNEADARWKYSRLQG